MNTTPYLAVEGDATLVVFENNKFRNCKLIANQQYQLGRAVPGNEPDIVLFSPIAGRQHGEFLCIEGQWFFIDKGSTNGTFYNGKKIEKGLNGKEKPIMLNSGDVLRIDAANLNKPDERGVWMLFSTDFLNPNWEKIELSETEATYIGRSRGNRISIDLPYISNTHAKISYSDGQFYVTDCDSLAGVWVNGEKIEKTCALKEKDKISLCDCHFVFSGKSLFYNINSVKESVSDSNQTILKADIETKKVMSNTGYGEKELIRDVHLEVKAGTLVALLGSSGAGKTTVMNCLNGMDRQGVRGTVFYKGEDLFKNFDRLKYLIGSVPQEEVFHEMLSVEEELRNAAIMRLPNDTTKDEIKVHVNKAIKQLNLEGVRKNKISKCSGGEKKRVNIAIELVAERQLLCLDEPDAGLDPGMKKELFSILKRLAYEEGKSILVIIHDVSEIDLFDQIIMMAKYDNVGRLAFSGTPEAAKEYFGTSVKEAYGLLATEPGKYLRGI